MKRTAKPGLGQGLKKDEDKATNREPDNLSYKTFRIFQFQYDVVKLVRA